MLLKLRLFYKETDTPPNAGFARNTAREYFRKFNTSNLQKMKYF